MDKLLAISCMLCIGINDYIFKVAADDNNGKSINIFYIIQTSFIMLICLIGLLVFKISLDLKSIINGLIIGVLSYITYLLLIKSLINNDASYSITIYRLNFIVSVIFAVAFLNESIGIKKVFGILFCLLSLFIFSGIGKGSGLNLKNGLAISIVACVLGGLLNSFNKIVVNQGIDTFSILFYRYIAVLILALIPFTVKKEKVTLPRKQLIYGFMSGMFMLLSLYLFYTALRYGKVVTVMPITQLSFVFTSVLSFMMLKEKLGWRKIAGICLSLGSIVMVSL